MDHSLTGKSALVTGGSRGIGRAIALKLASCGAAVVIGYVRNKARAQQVVTEINDAGGKAGAVQADLARASEVSRLFDEAERIVGKLDIVVANAADILVKPLADCSEEEYERIFATNTRSVFFTLQHAARRVNDHGRIIVSSTGATKLFYPGLALYLGSKGAVEQFVRTLACELGERQITVNAISPGPTDTDMMQDSFRATAAALSPFNRIGTPEDIADVAVFLASDAARWITGQNIGAGGGAF